MFIIGRMKTGDSKVSLIEPLAKAAALIAGRMSRRRLRAARTALPGPPAD